MPMEIKVLLLFLVVSIIYYKLKENDKTEREVIMGIGDQIKIKEYDFIFRNMKEKQEVNYDALVGVFDVKKDGKLITTLFPEKRIYFSNEADLDKTKTLRIHSKSQNAMIQSVSVALRAWRGKAKFKISLRSSRN